MKKFKFSGFGRRQVTLVALVILIAVAGYINLNHGDEEAIPASGDIIIQDESPESPPQEDSYFTLSRHERDRSRSAAMDVYREVTQNNDSTTEAKENAQKQLTETAKTIETETVIEGILKAKGFEEVIVYISDSSVNIVVKTIGLTPAQAAQIKDLVMENTKVAADKIKIVEIK